MKKIIFSILVLITILPVFVYAKEEVKLSKCIDGDTATFIINGKTKKVRFLAIDTPETKHPQKGTEAYGKAASKYTCKKLKTAKKIEIEFDSNSTKTDKYDRYLAWIFVDDELLQEKLVEQGLAKVAYLYDDYKYTDELLKKEKVAQKNKLRIWSENSEEESLKEDVINSLLESIYKTLLKFIKSML